MRIRPDDRYEDLLAAANVALEQDPVFGGLDRVSDHFRLEVISELRIVSITLFALVRPRALSISDIRALELLMEEGHEPISSHAFLALLGQYPEAGCVATGLTLPQPVLMNGYVGLLRFMYRKESKQKRTLGFFPARRLGRRSSAAGLGEYELFAGEPAQEATASISAEEC
ncbi:MAG: hypothetical protein WC866_03310 [Patescibacteria group bacterium]